MSFESDHRLAFVSENRPYADNEVCMLCEVVSQSTVSNVEEFNLGEWSDEIFSFDDCQWWLYSGGSWLLVNEIRLVDWGYRIIVCDKQQGPYAEMFNYRDDTDFHNGTIHVMHVSESHWHERLVRLARSRYPEFDRLSELRANWEAVIRGDSVKT